MAYFAGVEDWDWDYAANTTIKAMSDDYYGVSCDSINICNLQILFEWSMLKPFLLLTSVSLVLWGLYCSKENFLGFCNGRTRRQLVTVPLRFWTNSVTFCWCALWSWFIGLISLRGSCTSKRLNRLINDGVPKIFFFNFNETAPDGSYYLITRHVRL